MNQREIKFRAWDLLSEKYLPHSSDVHIEINSPNVYRLRSDGGYEQTETVVIQQYTGLKDKHGKEIYEGDVVRMNQWPKPVEIVYYENGFYLRDGIWSNWNSEDVEVIGNIYENPELLTPIKHKE